MRRLAAKAGTWYPSNSGELAGMVDGLLTRARLRLREVAEDRPPDDPARRQPVRAVVAPHAGLMYSGQTAALAHAALAGGPAGPGDAPDCVFLFGAVHRAANPHTAVWPDGAWETPLGDLAVDTEVAGQLAESAGACPDRRPHMEEHSIELQLPFVARLFPSARIVPVAVQPTPAPIDLGLAARRIADKLGRHAVAVGSTDLTHYGAAFGVMPAGRGPAAVAWTRKNSQPFLDALAHGRWMEALDTARRDGSACGAGAAVAAGVFAQGEAEPATGVLLDHATSAEVMGETAHADHIVGYAAMAFCGPPKGASYTEGKFHAP